MFNMNVQMKTNQEVMNQVKAWYDQVYPNMDEVEALSSTIYYLCGKKLTQNQYEACREKAYETYDIEVNHLEQVIIRQGYELDSCQLIFCNKQTGSISKKQIKQWILVNEATKMKEVWIFIF